MHGSMTGWPLCHAAPAKFSGTSERCEKSKALRCTTGRTLGRFIPVHVTSPPVDEVLIINNAATFMHRSSGHDALRATFCRFDVRPHGAMQMSHVMTGDKTESKTTL